MQDTVEDEPSILPLHSSPSKSASRFLQFDDFFDTPVQYPDLDISLCYSVSSFDILSTYNDVATEAQVMSPIDFYTMKTEENLIN
ncbi:unnamed protein product [Blepharisma stoltei]|uniref:Uncharacterized protein n=1 Tax=Blepharisma stoltei TaxID=1481888 RepID=A0AAU9IF42_9CILI|nr:unnamed protein product [Blepharisma stoltei]